MKKKIISLCLVLALALTAIGGATLAYFTDKGDVNNVFTVGNLDINLYEKTGIEDKDGKVVEEVVEKEETGNTYENLVPSYKIIKTPVVENVDTYDAYVRVCVVMNNVGKINHAIDGVYETADKSDEEIQAVYDKVFDGWGMSYTKRHVDGNNDRRLWMKERTNDEHVLFGGQIDMYCSQGTYGMFDVKNHFKNENDTNNEGFDYNLNGYYANAAKNDERVYVFYLKLDGKKGETVDSYKLFDGLNVPADFTNNAPISADYNYEGNVMNQMDMFNGLKIDVYADAIQVAGFATADEAFTALEAAHPMGWWNDTEANA